jgi:hypothetical protein
MMLHVIYIYSAIAHVEPKEFLEWMLAFSKRELENVYFGPTIRKLCVHELVHKFYSNLIGFCAKHPWLPVHILFLNSAMKGLVGEQVSPFAFYLH